MVRSDDQPSTERQALDECPKVVAAQLLGNIAGIIKRVAINYYGRSLMYDAGVEHGLAAPDARSFDPITPTDARIALLTITLAALALAWLIFRTRDYEEQPK